MSNNLMILPANEPENIRLIQIPDDYEEHEAYRYVTGLIAKAEEESFVIEHFETCGGSAANTIVGLARLGLKVGFIGKVGCDQEGEVLLEDLHNEEVDTNGVIHSSEGRSGSVMGFVDGEGERALYVDSGVNDLIDSTDINMDYAFQGRFLHLSSFVGGRSFQAQDA